jgi:hypothetical protein
MKTIHTDNADHSNPANIEAAPGQPTTGERSARIVAAFPVNRTEDASKSLEPIETLDLSGGCINWRESDHRHALEKHAKSKKLRNRD